MIKIRLLTLGIMTLLAAFLSTDIRSEDKFTWDFYLGETSTVSNSASVPIYEWFPDSGISVLPDENGKFIMFWGEFENYRTLGSSPFPEDHHQLSPKTPVFGKVSNTNSFDNGGSWLVSVFRQGGPNLIGFFHAEDHWFPHTSNNIAWKSIGVIYSTDNGISWSPGRQIITSRKPKPKTPEWGGAGDFGMIWDGKNNRWVCFYSEELTLKAAVSHDPDGSPRSWRKWYRDRYCEPGLGGKASPLKKLDEIPGANPTVHYNKYLDRWIMVWHGWEPSRLYISASADLLRWEKPRVLTESEFANGKAWYPTIIGNTHLVSGKSARLYYADIKTDNTRIFKSRTIEFILND